MLNKWSGILILDNIKDIENFNLGVMGDYEMTVTAVARQEFGFVRVKNTQDYSQELDFVKKLRSAAKRLLSFADSIERRK